MESRRRPGASSSVAAAARSVLVLLALQLGLIQAFLLQPPSAAPLHALAPRAQTLAHAAPPRLLHRRGVPVPPSSLAAAASSSGSGNDGEEEGEVTEEAACPCSDMGSGTGLGQAGPLTELCDVGDVVVLVLPDADAEGKNLALAVVDGDDEAILLCLRDAESSEWFRDYREEPRRGLAASAMLRVVGTAAYSQRNIPSLGGGVGYGAEAEDCWLIEVGDLETAGLDAGTRARLRRPIDNVGTAPWMFM